MARAKSIRLAVACWRRIASGSGSFGASAEAAGLGLAAADFGGGALLELLMRAGAARLGVSVMVCNIRWGRRAKKNAPGGGPRRYFAPYQAATRFAYEMSSGRC